MRSLVLGSESDLWWNWAAAELDSTRWGEAFRYWLTPELQSKVSSGRRQDLNDADWEKLRAAVLNVRAPILLDLLRLGCQWYVGELDWSELSGLRIMNYEPHVRLAPSRTLPDFAEALDSGENPFGEEKFGSNYRATRAAFRPDEVKGRPILVSENPSGTFTMLEGYTRLAVMTSLGKAGRLDPRPIPIVLGVCPRLKDWRLFGIWEGRLVRTDRSLY